MKKRKLTPGRVIVLGFLSVITIGAILLFLPISHNKNVDVSFIDALFTSTSAVCVTGLVVVDTADTYNLFGRIIIALLIQIGGLGITSIGIGLFALASKKKMDLEKHKLVKEAFNYHTMKGTKELIKFVLFTTIIFEFVGMIASFTVFIKDYDFLKALGISAFHSISSFNNAGFDILGGFVSLGNYQNNIALNLITSGLIIFGGIGFFVIYDLITKKSLKKATLHTRIVVAMTLILLAVGTILLKITEGSNITFLGAFFNSVTSRTAGFATYPIDKFSSAGLMVIIVLMFIGASPGSTGGGIKTTTFSVFIVSITSAIRNKECGIFKRKFPKTIIERSIIITVLSFVIVILSCFLLFIFEPNITASEGIFEVVSAFGTVGLSTGITPKLCLASKIVLMLTMFIGRLGPLTLATLWVRSQKSKILYPEENVPIG